MEEGSELSKPAPYQAPKALSEVPEQQASRPTGLTVLAIMNFIFGISAILSGISSFLMLPFKGSIDKVVDTAKNQSEAPAWAAKTLEFTSGVLTTEAIIIGGILSLVTGPLLLVSGSGYLRQQKGRGRGIGNIYAMIALFGVGLGYIFWNLGMLNLIELIYPVFTLVLINTVFKEDFVN